MKLALVHLAPDSTEPPLGLASMAAYLRSYADFHGAVIVDADHPLDTLLKTKPDLVGISALTYQYPAARALAAELRAAMPRVPLILGGYHISVFPDHLAATAFDVGVIGEGEQTLCELVKLFQRDGSLAPAGLRQIHGLVFRNEQRAMELTPPRPLIEPLDQIPMPAWDLFQRRSDYLAPRRGLFHRLGVYPAMLTSRGCPYQCAFCSPTRFWGHFRLFSAERVVEEMEWLARTCQADGLFIWDDLFTVNRTRLRRIADLFEANGLHRRLRLCIFGRTNLLDEEMADLLQRLRVEGIFFGLESGSQRVLDYLKKGTVRVENNYRALRLCKARGMRTVGTLIIGAPVETEEDLEDTRRLATSPDLDYAMICHLTPLPGTEVWEEARHDGLVSNKPDFDFASLDGWHFRERFVMTRHVSPAALRAWYERLRREANHRTDRPKLGWRELRHLLNRRLWNTAARQFLQRARR